MSRGRVGLKRFEGVDRARSEKSEEKRFAGRESEISRVSREWAGADMGEGSLLWKPGVEKTGRAVDGFILRAGMKRVRMEMRCEWTTHLLWFR